MNDVSMWSHILHASLVVKGVMLILLMASVASWTLIFQRGLTLRATNAALDRFEGEFWAGGNMSNIYRDLRNHPIKSEGLAAIFQAGFKEFSRLRSLPGLSLKAITDGVERAMRVARNRSLDALEEHLPLLATIGSVSPYVGLFGTVWGIMVSFQALSGAGQATISMVAPGISEALIATAMGLFAAIPAVVAYNRYNATIERLNSRYESFQEEFINILQHHAPELEATGEQHVEIT